VDLICGFVLGFGFIKVGCVILGVNEWLRKFRKESVWKFGFFEGFQLVLIINFYSVFFFFFFFLCEILLL
jgi:hypothetical protein